MSTLRQILCVCVMAAVLVMAFPVSSLAVDPVSAATMANAFAQAVTAYGASHGVSMMFDVTSTSGIGEQVHELWQRFRADQQTADDYASIAAAVWPGLYSKVQRVAGAVVGINLAAEYVADLDGFWNWLLSGPAEMTKVDNQYYEWTVNQDGTVSSIPLVNNPYAFIGNYQLYPLPVTRIDSDNVSATMNSPSDNIYGIFSVVSGVEWFIGISLTNSQFQYRLNTGNYSYSSSANGWQFVRFQAGSGGYFVGAHVTYSGNDTRPYAYFGSYDASAISTASDDLSISPYIGDTVPQDIYIPDNEDVNYAPLPASIPLNIPWDDSLYGDGQTLTDAQSEAIAGASDLVISDTGTLELADTASPPAPSPNEVYIPLLPVELPSFNFSLSGIWHYVVSWVQSLGAWLSLMFQTWAILPSAITIPVYATAVIVIVLGVYKRFFM